MNFAFLGDDPAVLPLLRAIAEDPRHTLPHAALVGESLAETIPHLGHCQIHSQWEDLLSHLSSFEALIAAGSQPDVLEGIKKLTSQEKPLLLFPHVDQESAFIYELTLVRDDLHIPLVPAFPARFHPAIREVQNRLQSKAAGRLLHIQFERELETTTPSVSSLNSATVDQELLADVDLLRFMGGDYNQVTALRSGTVGKKFTMQSVVLAGDNLPEASWSAKAASGPPTWKLTLESEHETAVLSATGDLDHFRLEIKANQEGAEEQPVKKNAKTDASAGQHVGSALLNHFEEAVSGRKSAPDWTDLTRAFEIVDASHRSLKRRRTIDLHFETTSERTIFKTQMTALGCGVLTYTFFATLVYLLVGTLFSPPEFLMQIGRAVVFLPLGLFLLLQLLLLITRPSIDESTATDTTTAESVSQQSPKD